MRRLRRAARVSTVVGAAAVLRSACLTGLLIGTFACQRASRDDEGRASPGPVAPTPPVEPPPTAAQARPCCEAELSRAMARPAVPAMAAQCPVRVELLARAKAEPVFFIRTPTYGGTPNASTRH